MPKRSLAAVSASWYRTPRLRCGVRPERVRAPRSWVKFNSRRACRFAPGATRCGVQKNCKCLRRAILAPTPMSVWSVGPLAAPNQCELRGTAKARWRQVHLGSSASAQSWLPGASLSCTLWSHMKDAALLQLVGSAAQCQQAAAGLLLPNRRSNPSIERTVTSGLRPLVTAAHVKR
jgi:hypothetical protein